MEKIELFDWMLTNLRDNLSLFAAIIISLLGISSAIFVIYKYPERVDLATGMIMTIITAWSPSPINFQKKILASNKDIELK